MPDPDPSVHRTTTEARSGETPHIVRYVLFISLALALLAMAVIVLSENGADKEPNAAPSATNGASAGGTSQDSGQFMDSAAVPTVDAPATTQAPEPGTVTQQGPQPAPSET